MYKHKKLNMGQETSEAKNIQSCVCLINLSAKIHTKVNRTTHFSATFTLQDL